MQVQVQRVYLPTGPNGRARVRLPGLRRLSFGGQLGRWLPTGFWGNQQQYLLLVDTVTTIIPDHKMQVGEFDELMMQACVSAFLSCCSRTERTQALASLAEAGEPCIQDAFQFVRLGTMVLGMVPQNAH